MPPRVDRVHAAVGAVAHGERGECGESGECDGDDDQCAHRVPTLLGIVGAAGFRTPDEQAI